MSALCFWKTHFLFPNPWKYGDLFLSECKWNENEVETNLCACTYIKSDENTASSFVHGAQSDWPVYSKSRLLLLKKPNIG